MRRYNVAHEVVKAWCLMHNHAWLFTPLPPGAGFWDALYDPKPGLADLLAR